LEGLIDQLNQKRVLEKIRLKNIYSGQEWRSGAGIAEVSFMAKCGNCVRGAPNYITPFP
jgi:hypothetical protein